MLKFTPKRRLTGGVRLPAHKDASTRLPIKRGLIPSRLIVSTRQHRGADTEPVVAVGDKVLKGQMLAKTNALDGADVHAPTSGLVIAIERYDVPLAAAVTNEVCIVIEPDGDDRRADAQDTIELGTTLEDRARQIAAAGIVGLGGAIYPTAAKLNLDPNCDCKLLIINGAECEPYISCDDMLMREAPEEILEGAEILRQIVGAEQCIVAIERDKPIAIENVTAAAEKLGFANISIAELPSIYPAGGERQLVDVLGNVEVPSRSFPGDVGFLCQNVGTAFAVQRYFRQGEPLTSRIVTITGSAVAEPHNVEAMIGTPIRDLIEACGGYSAGATRLIQGGSMMGFALADDSMPITKATNCIIAAQAEELQGDTREWPCIRCGECAIACPARLQPQDLVLAARDSNALALNQLAVSECIECGCCDVVCPSHIRLTQTFRQSKPLARAFLAQQDFSEQSDQRYRSREQRRHEAVLETDRTREAIKQSLAEDGDRTEAIRSAVARAKQRKAEPDGS